MYAKIVDGGLFTPILDDLDLYQQICIQNTIFASILCVFIFLEEIVHVLFLLPCGQEGSKVLVILQAIKLKFVFFFLYLFLLISVLVLCSLLSFTLLVSLNSVNGPALLFGFQFMRSHFLAGVLGQWVSSLFQRYRGCAWLAAWVVQSAWRYSWYHPTRLWGDAGTSAQT